VQEIRPFDRRDGAFAVPELRTSFDSSVFCSTNFPLFERSLLEEIPLSFGIQGQCMSLSKSNFAEVRFLSLAPGHENCHPDAQVLSCAA
jgi:hypothetical protein